MILSNKDILEMIEEGAIKIVPFLSENLGTNSYDVRLSKHLAVYKDSILDCKKENEIERFEITQNGFLLTPGRVYLGSTIEYTETHNLVPILEGKSSIGRLGIDIHATAGIGDVGFCNHWTLELSVKQPVRIYPGMLIGQLIYFTVGEVDGDYKSRKGSKYTQVSILPGESKMYKNFI